MLPVYHDFKAITKHEQSEQCNYLQNLIKYEMYSTLPHLDESEIKERNKIHDSTRNNKEELLEKLTLFYTKIKEKYINFYELKYLNDIELLDELYDYIIEYENKKSSTKNSYFDYSFFLKKQIEKTVPDEWDIFIEEKLDLFKSNAIKNYDGFWLNALFDSIFNTGETKKVNINDMIKYNIDMTSYSIIITLELFYSNILLDIYTLLINRPDTKRIILKFEQRSYWVGANITPLVYVDDDEWNFDMNNILNVFLNSLLTMNKLQALSMVAESGCEISLNKTNTELLQNVLENNKDTLEIFSSNRFEYFDEVKIQTSMINQIINLSLLKVLILQGARFDEDVLEIANEYFKNKEDSIIYIRFNRENIFVNKNQKVTGLSTSKLKDYSNIFKSKKSGLFNK